MGRFRLRSSATWRYSMKLYPTILLQSKRTAWTEKKERNTYWIEDVKMMDRYSPQPRHHAKELGLFIQLQDWYTVRLDRTGAS